MRLYLRFEKGLIAGFLLGGPAAVVLVEGGPYAAAVEKSGSTLAVLEVAAVVVLSALVGGVFFALCGRWSATPVRGLIFGLGLGGLLLLLQEQVAALLSLLLRVPVNVDLSLLLRWVGGGGWPEGGANVFGLQATEIVGITGGLLYGSLQGLLFAWLWRRDVRRSRAIASSGVRQSTTAS
jgi:hypothetical protein